ncbi:MAG TPA: hypothetical protein DCS28_03205 [Candidatus Moranbacteria bacterium]|nr:hypothetical protein [Candidatus Moranbacteria bacterium]HAT75019.1 hypothetical protein [Candidatus Moranbacteria bacterium]
MKKFLQKFKIKDKKGLTLVEMIIAIAVLSITILASTAVSATYLTSRMSIKKYQANSEELSMAMNFLAKDIRMSNCPVAASTCVLPNATASSTITIYNNATGGLITYAFNSTNSTLTRKAGSGNAVPIISNVTGAFYARNIDADQIARITIRLQKTGTPSMAAQTTVSMRNKYKE